MSPVAGEASYSEFEAEVALLRGALERLAKAIESEHDGDQKPRRHSVAVMMAVKHAKNVLADPRSPRVAAEGTIALIDTMLYVPDDEVRP